MFRKFSEAAPWVGNVAQWIAACIATIGITLVLVQVHANGKNSRQASARQAYTAYMDRGLQYPHLIRPDYAALKAKRGDEYEQYIFFVGYMLTAYDEIFASIDEPEWYVAFSDDASGHLAFLCEDATPGYLAQYTPRPSMRFIANGLSSRTAPSPVSPPLIPRPRPRQRFRDINAVHQRSNNSRLQRFRRVANLPSSHSGWDNPGLWLDCPCRTKQLRQVDHHQSTGCRHTAGCSCFSRRTTQRRLKRQSAD